MSAMTNDKPDRVEIAGAAACPRCGQVMVRYARPPPRPNPRPKRRTIRGSVKCDLCGASTPITMRGNQRNVTGKCAGCGASIGFRWQSVRSG
jgi:transcription elongation factor Elf1